MGEAAAKSGSMEDILASIRKIISSDVDENGASAEMAGNADAAVAAIQKRKEPEFSASEPLAEGAEKEPVASSPFHPAPAPGSKPAEGDGATLKEAIPAVASRPQSNPVVPKPQASREPPVSEDDVRETDSSAIAPARASGSLAELTRSVRKQEAEKTALQTPPEEEKTVSTEKMEKPEQDRVTTEKNPESLEKRDIPIEDDSKKVDAATAVRSEAKAIEQLLEDMKPASTAMEAETKQMEAKTGENAENDAEPETTGKKTAETISDDAAGIKDSKRAKEQLPEEETSKFREALVSPSTREAVAGSMERLKAGLGDVREAQVEAVLRPMLREWLDENLPQMVENIVREEIARISRTDSE